MKTQLLFGSLFMLFLVSCASNFPGRVTSQNLYGMIYDGHNRPVNGVTIQIDGKYHAASDINGHFIITGIRRKTGFRVSARKQGFEPMEMEISRPDPSHVLYMRILSGDQLLEEAEKAVRNKRWHEARIFLDRAETAGADPALLRYLGAVLACGREEYAEALRLLGDIALTVRDAPYLYLLMADICQYRLEAPEQARTYLERFLELRYDEEIARRRNQL